MLGRGQKSCTATLLHSSSYKIHLPEELKTPVRKKDKADMKASKRNEEGKFCLSCSKVAQKVDGEELLPGDVLVFTDDKDTCERFYDKETCERLMIKIPVNVFTTRKHVKGMLGRGQKSCTAALLHSSSYKIHLPEEVRTPVRKKDTADMKASKRNEDGKIFLSCSNGMLGRGQKSCTATLLHSSSYKIHLPEELKTPVRKKDSSYKIHLPEELKTPVRKKDKADMKASKTKEEGKFRLSCLKGKWRRVTSWRRASVY
ncbi:hypothetical protein QE152_g24944 [Popillia japonica]|uniref:Uncharacterized protein n=1 Tax=Popillia japonica TaxID=7064 RepID=A0AAW1K260_POPJA